MKRLALALLLLLTSAAFAQQGPVFNSPPRYDAANVSITGGSITGITDLAVADGGTGASTAQGAAANLGAVYIQCQSAVAVSGAADTVNNVLYSCPIPANALGLNGRLRYYVTFTYTSSANNKTIRTYLGGTAGTIYRQLIATTTNLLSWCGQIANRNSASSQVSDTSTTQSTCGAGALSGAVVTSTINTGTATTLDFACQKALGTEACTIENVLVETMYGASLSLDRFTPDALRNAIAANDANWRAVA